MSIANTYLAKGAAGDWWPPPISPTARADANGNADIICQLFIEQLLRGCLARPRDARSPPRVTSRQQSVVDPYDEKTLAQFVLLGYSSLHPFPESTAPTVAIPGRQVFGACRPPPASCPLHESG